MQYKFKSTQAKSPVLKYSKPNVLPNTIMNHLYGYEEQNDCYSTETKALLHSIIVGKQTHSVK